MSTRNCWPASAGTTPSSTAWRPDSSPPSAPTRASPSRSSARSWPASASRTPPSTPPPSRPACAKADEYQALAARLNRLTNDDPEVRALRRAAAAAIEAGEFEAADLRLAEAEARDLDVVEELESLAARRRLSAAETRAERGAAARLRLDYRAAADHYAEAATIVPATDREARWWFRMEQGSALYDQGAEFGDNPALNQAIAAYGLALGLVSRAKQPSDWALTQTDLGGALRLLGEREAGTARLEEAAEAFRAALGELSRERAPLAWAVIQSKLGGAL